MLQSSTHQTVGKFQFSVPRVDLEYVERRGGVVSDLSRQLDWLVHFNAQNLGVVGREGDGGEIGPDGDVRQSHQDNASNSNHVVAVEHDADAARGGRDRGRGSRKLHSLSACIMHLESELTWRQVTSDSCVKAVEGAPHLLHSTPNHGETDSQSQLQGRKREADELCDDSFLPLLVGWTLRLGLSSRV